MEKRNQAQANQEKGRLLYDTIIMGVSFTAAAIRTNVFEHSSVKDSADTLRTTLRLLKSTDVSKKDDIVRKAEIEVRQAIKRMIFLGSKKRASQINEQPKHTGKKKKKIPPSNNAFVRHANVQLYSPINRIAARVTRIPKKKK